jgi:hypothetical protein
MEEAKMKYRIMMITINLWPIEPKAGYATINKEKHTYLRISSWGRHILNRWQVVRTKAHWEEIDGESRYQSTT